MTLLQAAKSCKGRVAISSTTAPDFSNFVIADYTDIEKTNQNDILEIDESQFDSEFLNISRKTLDQFKFSKVKSVISLSSISYTKVEIDVVIPPPDYIS